jgi:hypothetical protein
MTPHARGDRHDPPEVFERVASAACTPRPRQGLYSMVERTAIWRGRSRRPGLPSEKGRMWEARPPRPTVPFRRRMPSAGAISSQRVPCASDDRHRKERGAREVLPPDPFLPLHSALLTPDMRCGFRGGRTMPERGNNKPCSACDARPGSRPAGRVLRCRAGAVRFSRNFTEIADDGGPAGIADRPRPPLAAIQRALPERRAASVGNGSR